MTLLIKTMGLLTLSQAMTFPLFAHTGMHQMTVFEVVKHFFSSPMYLGGVVIVCALIFALVVHRSIMKS